MRCVITPEPLFYADSFVFNPSFGAMRLDLEQSQWHSLTIHHGPECLEGTLFDNSCAFNNDVSDATKLLKYFGEILATEKKTAIKFDFITKSLSKP